MSPFPLALAALVLAAVVVLRRRLSRALALVGLALAAGLAVYGSGAVELPSLEGSIEEIGPKLGAWTYLLVGLLAFLETGAFIGLVAPGELALVLGGFVAGQGEVELALLIPLAWLAAVAGDTLSYALGRKLGRGFLLRYGPKFKVSTSGLERVERYFAAHGGKTILVGRFIGIVRALAPFIAGTSRMRFRRFLLADTIGAGLWSSTFVVLGYLFWQSFDRALALARQGKLVLTALVLLALAVFVLWRALRRREERVRLRAQILAGAARLQQRCTLGLHWRARSSAARAAGRGAALALRASGRLRYVTLVAVALAATLAAGLAFLID